MDPTYKLARIQYSFTDTKQPLFIPWFSYTESQPNITQPKQIEDEIQHLFDYANKDFLVMANIDIVNYTLSIGGYLAQQTNGLLTYAFIKPTIGQIEYLQWRRPACYGYVSLVNGDDVDTDMGTNVYIDTSNVTKHYGDYEEFSNYVRTIEIDGVDLALSNDSSVSALIACCDCLKRGGTCIIAYSNPQMLFNMSLMFERILLFRPMCDVEKLYCIGMGYNENKYKNSRMTESFVKWFNNLHNPHERIDTYLAKAIWNL
jgi:hypothetical protein